MSNTLFKLKPLCLGVLLCASAAANATITLYTSAADFLTAVSAPGIDTFDDLSPVQLASSLARDAGGWSYQVSAPGGLYGAGGPGDVWLSTKAATDPITFSQFSAGVYAFGGNFFGSDQAGGFSSGGDLVLTASDGSTLSFALNGATPYSFVGFISDTALTSVTLESAPGSAVWPTAGSVVLAVPEPATYGMFLAGLGFLGLMARRRT